MAAADKLKKIRELLGKGQKEMAEAMGINYRTYQNYENAASDPSWSACESLVKMGFNANWLLTGVGEMKLGEGEVKRGEGTTISLGVDLDLVEMIIAEFTRFNFAREDGQGAAELEMMALQTSSTIMNLYAVYSQAGLEPSRAAIRKFIASAVGTGKQNDK